LTNHASNSTAELIKATNHTKKDAMQHVSIGDCLSTPDTQPLAREAHHDYGDETFKLSPRAGMTVGPGAPAFDALENVTCTGALTRVKQDL